MNFYYYVKSDIGSTRKTNQDSVYAKKINTALGTAFLGIVCDGMGGLSDGEAASSMVVEAFSDWYEQDFRYIMDGSCEFSNIKNQWHILRSIVHKELKNYGFKNHVVLGTTLSALLLIRNSFFAVQIGDSRIYRVRSGIVEHITKDHSYVMELAEKGLMTYDEASVSKKKNILTRCIGNTGECKADFFTGETFLGDCFIISSDGFHGGLKSDIMNGVIKSIASCKGKETRRRMDNAVYDKIKNGERDNISAVCVKAY